MHYLEIVGRVAAVYVACMILLRLTRREMAELGPMDLLTMLLLSETVSSSLTGGDQTLTGGLTAACALVAMGTLSEKIAFRWRRVERVIQGHAVVLIEKGRVDANVMRRFRITDDDLKATLHDKGLLSVDQVRRGYVEADGSVTIIKAD